MLLWNGLKTILADDIVNDNSVWSSMSIFLSFFGLVHKSKFITGIHRQARIFYTVTILCTCWVCLLFIFENFNFDSSWHVQDTQHYCVPATWYTQPSPAVCVVSVCCRKSHLRMKPPRFTGPQMAICVGSCSESKHVPQQSATSSHIHSCNGCRSPLPSDVAESALRWDWSGKLVAKAITMIIAHTELWIWTNPWSWVLNCFWYTHEGYLKSRVIQHPRNHPEHHSNHQEHSTKPTP